MDMRGKTREEAVLLLLSLQEHVNMLVQYRPHGKSSQYELGHANELGHAKQVSWSFSLT